MADAVDSLVERFEVMIIKKISRQRQWQIKQRSLGKCESCGKDAEEVNGVFRKKCRECADKYNARLRRNLALTKESTKN